MTERDSAAEPEREPLPYELEALVAQQRESIVHMHETIRRQEALIDELQEAALAGRRWKPSQNVTHIGDTDHGLTARAEAILRLAEDEAKTLREEARRAADARIAIAEQEAARIRAEAVADVVAAEDGEPGIEGGEASSDSSFEKWRL